MTHRQAAFNKHLPYSFSSPSRNSIQHCVCNALAELKFIVEVCVDTHICRNEIKRHTIKCSYTACHIITELQYRKRRTCHSIVWMLSARLMFGIAFCGRSFYDAVTTLAIQHIASDGRTTDEWWIGKDSVGDGHGLVDVSSRNLPAGKTDFSHVSRCPGPDSNRAPPE
jgi:hypothetical protein